MTNEELKAIFAEAAKQMSEEFTPTSKGGFLANYLRRNKSDVKMAHC